MTRLNETHCFLSQLKYIIKKKDSLNGNTLHKWRVLSPDDVIVSVWRYLPFNELLARGAQETPQIIPAVARALGCLPELTGKTQLLETLVRDRRSQPRPERAAPSLQTGIRGAERHCAGCQGREVTMALSACGACVC